MANADHVIGSLVLTVTSLALLKSPGRCGISTSCSAPHCSPRLSSMERADDATIASVVCAARSSARSASAAGPIRERYGAWELAYRLRSPRSASGRARRQRTLCCAKCLAGRSAIGR